jgi:hypothetical protein
VKAPKSIKTVCGAGVTADTLKYCFLLFTQDTKLSVRKKIVRPATGTEAATRVNQATGTGLEVTENYCSYSYEFWNSSI